MKIMGYWSNALNVKREGTYIDNFNSVTAMVVKPRMVTWAAHVARKGDIK